MAEDRQRPGNPLCVVRQLKLASDRPTHLQVARRLFQLEAETLEKLGKHDQNNSQRPDYSNPISVVNVGQEPPACTGDVRLFHKSRAHYYIIKALTGLAPHELQREANKGLFLRPNEIAFSTSLLL